MKIYLHHLPGFPIVRNNVADPFMARDGRAVLRPEVEPSGLEITERLADADICALPAHWHAYPAELQRAALAFVGEQAPAGKRTMIWVNGDDEIAFPLSGILAFQHAVRRSRRRPFDVRVYPAFIQDIGASSTAGEARGESASGRPVVGFCGQAVSRPGDEAKRLVGKIRSRIAWAAGLSTAVPEPWASHVRLRARTLDALANDPRIETNFLVRDRYRAGLRAKADRRNLAHPTALDFFANISSSDYTVCVRGGGNFSVRLYETLCLGRLPLIIDTDSLLPWPNSPAWSAVALTIPVRELSTMGDRLIAHEQGSRSRHDRFAGARTFWNDRLSMTGYFSHFKELLVDP